MRYTYQQQLDPHTCLSLLSYITLLDTYSSSLTNLRKYKIKDKHKIIFD